MIAPGKFYTNDDTPHGERRKRMWKNIEKETQERKGGALFIADKRSFVMGIAASVILYFTVVGLYTTVSQSIERAQPNEVRLDAAYRSAIEEFESVIPNVAANAADDGTERDYLASRKEQLRKLDLAIESLRSETTRNDFSPLKQQRLRQLYSLKLRVLQEMVENGEIEL